MFVGQILKSKISLLEASNAELQREVKERQIHCEQLTQSAIDAQVCLLIVGNFFNINWKMTHSGSRLLRICYDRLKGID